MRWKNLKGEYQVIFYFLERAVDMKGEHQIATAKASSNKGITALSSEAATPFYKTLGKQHPERSAQFWLFQYQAHTDKLEGI